MVQVVEAIYENGILKVPEIKDKVLIVIIKNKESKIEKYAGILKNVKKEDIERALEEIESGSYIY